MFSILPFKEKEDKHDLHRGKKCTKKFCECLQKHTRDIINF